MAAVIDAEAQVECQKLKEVVLLSTKVDGDINSEILHLDVMNTARPLSSGTQYSVSEMRCRGSGRAVVYLAGWYIPTQRKRKVEGEGDLY